MQSAEVDWQTLDKTRFFVVGGAMFTGLTTCLFPLSVIKTRQMALENAPRGIKGAYLTAQSIVQHDGVRGLYKGFGTTISGAIPTRIVYLSALEIIKSATSSVLHRYHLSDTVNVGLASFIAGGGASLVAQAVYVPVDVVSQRLMIMGGGLPSAQHTAAQQASSASIAPAAGASSAMGGGSSSGGSSTASRVPQQQQQLQQQQQQQQIRQQQGHSRPQPRMNGLHVARQIVAVEGVRGLYRGFGASVMTFVPNSAIWWGCYGAYQRLFWHQIDAWRGAHRRSEGELLAVQATAGVLTGFTTASITNPLDVVKTRLQTRDFVPGKEQPTISGVVGQLLRTEGVKGFYRGVAPRMVSSAIWGTAMVTTYEFLKRLCALPPRPQTAAAAL